MTLDLTQVEVERRIVLERLLQLHLYEIGLVPGPDGLIDWEEPLEDYVGESDDSNKVAMFVTHDGDVAGFVLIRLNRTLRAPDGRTDVRSNVIEEFHVTRPHRRKGLGTTAVHRTFDRYRGLWTITTWPDEARVAFWRHATLRYGRGTRREFAPDEHQGFPGQFVWTVTVGDAQ